MNSDFRDKARKWYRGSDRTILATLKDNLDGTDRPISVFKVKENGILFMEFYVQKSEVPESGGKSSIELIQRIELPNPIDGFVTFMGEATNLAVANLDGDLLLELLVPSYNLEFSPSLDVIKFNAGLGKFELMSSFDIPENLLKSIQKGAR